jgi:uncharacterized membrane protein
MDSKALVFILLLAGSVSATSGDINIVVSENGNAFTIIVLEGEGTIEIPLPLDVSDPVVKGCLYVHSADGIEVSLTEDDVATVAYKTTLLTSKEGDGWVLEAGLPELGESRILVSLPGEAIIRDSHPPAGIMDANDSKNLVWENTNTINVSYTYPAAVSTTLEAQTTPTTLKEEEPSKLMAVVGWITLAVVLLLMLATAVYTALKMYHRFRRTRITEGMANVMKTMSGNEYKVVDTLLKHGGGMKRSGLERAAGISKSSLSVALNNLERKGVLEVNREYTAHYVELTEWFRGL